MNSAEEGTGSFVGKAEAELDHREVMELLRLEVKQQIPNTKRSNTPWK